MKPNTIILISAIIVLTIIELFALSIDSHYKYDYIFVMILLIGCFLIRSEINLHPVHYSLFALFLFFHMLGTFQMYEFYPLGIEYDHWIHGLFGFVSALMLYRFLKTKSLIKAKYHVIAVIIILLGMSALHELYEYAGALLLGEGEGVLFIGAGDLDQWDTQNDMLNNVIGGIFGLLINGFFINNKKEITKMFL